MGADAGPLWSQLSQRKTWEEPCLQRYNPICHRGQISQPYPDGEGLSALAQKTEEGSEVRDGFSHPLASLGWSEKGEDLPSSGSRSSITLTLLCPNTEVTASPPLGKGVQVRDRLHWKERYWISTDVPWADFVCWFVSLLCCASHPNHIANDVTAQCVDRDDSLAWELSLIPALPLLPLGHDTAHPTAFLRVHGILGRESGFKESGAPKNYWSDCRSIRP